MQQFLVSESVCVTGTSVSSLDVLVDPPDVTRIQRSTPYNQMYTCYNRARNTA